VSFAAITLCVASQLVFIVAVVVVYFIIDSVRKLLDTPTYDAPHYVILIILPLFSLCYIQIFYSVFYTHKPSIFVRLLVIETKFHS
jgi:hypothetical protein